MLEKSHLNISIIFHSSFLDILSYEKKSYDLFFSLKYLFKRNVTKYGNV